MPAQRTDDDCTLWFCEACQASGVLTMEPGDRDVYGVVAAIKIAHLVQSPECQSDQRVVRPMFWYLQLLAFGAVNLTTPP